MLHANKKHKKHKSMFDDEENNNIRNKLNSLEQENLVTAEGGKSDGAADVEVFTME